VYSIVRESHIAADSAAALHLVSRPLTDEQLLEPDGRNRELSGSPAT